MKFTHDRHFTVASAMVATVVLVLFGGVSSPAQSVDINSNSLQALAEKSVVGKNLRIIKKIASNSTYATYDVRYESGRFTISGLLSVPHAEGPFPAVVIGHGYAKLNVYKSGDGFAKERDYLARSGFIVLHTDYRNHAKSDKDPNNILNLRLDYTEDVIAAAAALRDSSITRLDKDHIVYFGRSMGGGIGYNISVAAPNVFDALVLFSPVSANYIQNFNRSARNNDTVRELISSHFGLPESNPDFWRGISPLHSLHNVQDPVLIHHGVADTTCPIKWTDAAVAEYRKADVRVVYHVYKGEQHIFKKKWKLSMKRSVNFLKTEILKVSN